MNVRELIEKLQALDPELQVYTTDSEYPPHNLATTVEVRPREGYRDAFPVPAVIIDSDY